MTKLCWNAIVRNESARIERCMLSLVHHISSYVVVDTGSSDGTPGLIREFFAKHNIPGEVHHTRFINFEQARNEALIAARKSPIEFDYMLLVDADMELVAEKPAWANALGGDSYDMQQRAGAVHYGNRRLVRKNTTGMYVGVTHEYLDVPSAGMVDGAYFVDHADGENRKDKFARDIELLEVALKADPNNGRYLYYLGQSYRDAHKWSKAANAYKKCVAAGGWDEQVWSAQSNYAHCIKELDGDADFVHEMLVAHNMRPSRAETLYDLAKHYREKGMNSASLVFSEAGMLIPPSSDILFVNNFVYETGLREEFSICAFYEETKRARGAAVIDHLGLDLKVPAHTRYQARSNSFFYLEPLAKHVGHIAHHRIPFTPPDGYTATNPSILTRANGDIQVLVRTVNYTITDSGHYAIRGGDGSINNENPIRTRNFLQRLDAKFAPLENCEVLPPRDQPAPEYNLVIGFEDMRLAEFNGAMWINACVREMNAEGWCEQVVAKIGADGYLCAARRMLPKLRREHEKNWMPWVRQLPGGGTAIHYLYRLGQVVDWDANPAATCRVEADVGHISGGSQVIPFGDAYLAVVHEARVSPQNGQRYYQHRFVRMTSIGEVLKISAPFAMQDRQIEFVAGLARHPDGKRLMISYGVRDREAWITTVDVDDVQRMVS